MSIHICSGKNDLKFNLKNSKVQSVPVKIHADCDAEVKKYFETSVEQDENKSLKASFRGYPFRGTNVQIPENYTGFVLSESIQPSHEYAERKFFIINKFKEIVYWNWDKIPSKNDGLTKALDWIDIAEELHKPITED